jgi:uncharacterized protein DUF4129
VTEGPRTRLVRALLLGAAALVLLGLVAIAASGYKVSGSGSSQPTPYAVDTIVTIVLALYAVGTVATFAAMLWTGLEVRRNPVLQKHRRRRTVSSLALLLAVAALLLFASDRFDWRPRLGDRQTTTEQSARAPQNRADRKTRGERREPQFRLAPFLAVVGAAAVAVAALAVAERRRRRRLPGEQPRAEELVTVLDEALEDLRGEPDPRRAVIAAYARMERELGAHGIPRRGFEAPHEYLGRVLAELTGAAGPARTLTGLFERARFSPHDVDARMKEAAIVAVEDLQAALAAAEAGEAA